MTAEQFPQHEQWKEIVDRAPAATTPAVSTGSHRKTGRAGGLPAPPPAKRIPATQRDPWTDEGTPRAPRAAEINATMKNPSTRAAAASRSAVPDRPWGSAIRREILWGGALAASIAALVLLLRSEASFVFPLAVFLVGERALHNFWIAELERRVRAPRPQSSETHPASDGDPSHRG
jgi:hypothetical protein